VSYRTPGLEQAPLPPGLPAKVRRDEQAFQQWVRGQEFARATVESHGALPDRIREILPEAKVRVAGRYRFQTVYLVRR
jgi:hypothetical protein